MELTKPAITRLARQAGVKSISDDCFSSIRALLVQRLDHILQNSLIVNEQHQTKTLMVEDIYEALEIDGEFLAQSNDLGISTIGKQ